MNILKFLLILIGCVFFNWCHAEKQNYTVTSNRYHFSTIFDMKNDEHLCGSVVRSKFRPKTHYYSYDACGVYEGQGSCRLFCLGIWYTWGTEIDIYDEQGEKIGMIDGQLASAEPAKFSIYDGSGNKIAIGYLDQNRMGFKFYDANQPNVIVASLTRNFVIDAIDNWDVVNYYPEAFSPLIIKIFAAFACDTQDKFKKDR